MKKKGFTFADLFFIFIILFLIFCPSTWKRDRR